MMQTRLWQLMVLLLLLVPALLLGAVGAQAQSQSTAGKAKVERLVMGLILPYRDYMRPWIIGTPDHNIQHDPAFEWLFEVSPEGAYKPWLATSHTMAKDGRSWRITLQKGVQFHHGYGEFTVHDVIHNHALWCDDKYPGRKDPPSIPYRNCF
jgi:ABC-type transport system substrate-binding protein